MIGYRVLSQSKEIMTGVYLLFSFQKKYVSTYSWNEDETGSGKEVRAYTAQQPKIIPKLQDIRSI
jgi:hypothetical protein